MVRAALAFAVLIAAFAADAGALDLKGLDGKTVSVSAADFSRLPRTKFTIVQHGKKHVFQGPLLMHVLRFVNAPNGEGLKGPDLADVVIVTAKDGYRVALGLAEADLAMQPERIIIADTMDGAPLPDNDGPYRLVIEGDKRPARTVRMVDKIELRRIAP